MSFYGSFAAFTKQLLRIRKITWDAKTRKKANIPTAESLVIDKGNKIKNALSGPKYKKIISFIVYF